MIVAYTRPENLRSVRVLQEAGFRFRGERIYDGAAMLCDVYEISIVEWKKAQKVRVAPFPRALDS